MMMKTKNFKNVFALSFVVGIVFVGLLNSCNLDRFPETQLSDKSFWKDENNFRDACNQLYNFIDGSVIAFDDERSNISTNQSPSSINDGSRLANSTSSEWDLGYQGIFTANNIVEKAEDADFETIDRWMGEARLFRAYFYFDLVKKFGDVPLILKTLDINSEELSEGRTDREVVLSQIYEDLEYAVSNLPSFLDMGSGEYGRVSKGAALALISRIGLYFGTHQKFHGWGNSNDNLDKSIAASEELMTAGYELFNETDDPYYNLFQTVGEGFDNRENIWSVIYGSDMSNNIRSHNIGRNMENGRALATRAMVEWYLCTDGLPLDVSPLSETPEVEPESIFKNKDPRMHGSIFMKGDPYGNPSTYPWDETSQTTRYSFKKYSIVADWINSNSFVDVHIIRYAEILLNYAEAVFERDGAISDDDLDKSINILRDRVSMPHLTNGFVATNNLDMQEEIRRERIVELAQEGFHYDDIIRWKTAEDVMPKTLYGAFYFSDVYGNMNVDQDNGLIIVQSESRRSFDPERDYLYPIPVNEIALTDEAITQNPKW